MLRIFANYHNFALALDHFTFLTHGLHRRSYFQFLNLLFREWQNSSLPFTVLRTARQPCSQMLFTSPGDPAAGQIIGRHLDCHLVARQDSDKIHPEFSGNMRQNRMTISNVHTESGVWQRFCYDAFQLNYVIFGQADSPPLGFPGSRREIWQAPFGFLCFPFGPPLKNG